MIDVGVLFTCDRCGEQSFVPNEDWKNLECNPDILPDGWAKLTDVTGNRDAYLVCPQCKEQFHDLMVKWEFVRPDHAKEVRKDRKVKENENE